MPEQRYAIFEIVKRFFHYFSAEEDYVQLKKTPLNQKTEYRYRKKRAIILNCKKTTTYENMTIQKSILSARDQKDMNFSMRLSFLMGLLMLIIKFSAYYITHSTAILSDAAESIIHIFAVGFATYSMWLSLKPADENHPYGHEKISFFSAGFEGAMIIIAAIYIYFESIQKMIYGIELQNINIGLCFILTATFINFFLGYFLIRKGKKYKSIILEANGKHILTDCLTSFGVIVALLLVLWTGISLFDPIIAMIAATNILWTGGKLIQKSVKGLMDQTDPCLDRQIKTILTEETSKRNLEFHHLRHRKSGYTVFIEFHLLFPNEITLEVAHEIATEIEGKLHLSLEPYAEISTHLEPKTHHDEVHKKYGLSK